MKIAKKKNLWVKNENQKIENYFVNKKGSEGKKRNYKKGIRNKKKKKAFLK